MGTYQNSSPIFANLTKKNRNEREDGGVEGGEGRKRRKGGGATGERVILPTLKKGFKLAGGIQ